MTTETDDSFPINDYIMSLNLDNENIKKRRRNNEDQPKNSFLNNKEDILEINNSS